MTLELTPAAVGDAFSAFRNAEPSSCPTNAVLTVLSALLLGRRMPSWRPSAVSPSSVGRSWMARALPAAQIQDLFGSVLAEPGARFELEVALRARALLQAHRHGGA